MPKSHSARLLTNKAPIEWVIGLKVTQRRKRFSVKKKITLGFVSSSKHQKKGLRLKKGQRFHTRHYHWSKVASIINKKMDKEENIFIK